MAEQGQPLTRESLSKAYYELNQKYYGAVCTVDENIANEWMRIPHFYRSYYVYVYATGLSRGGFAQPTRFCPKAKAPSATTASSCPRAAPCRRLTL